MFHDTGHHNFCLVQAGTLRFSILLDSQKNARITPETECGNGHPHFWVYSFVRHPVDTKLASRRATEKIFYKKIIRIKFPEGRTGLEECKQKSKGAIGDCGLNQAKIPSAEWFLITQ